MPVTYLTEILTSSRDLAGPWRGWIARAGPSASTASGSGPPPSAPPRLPPVRQPRRPRREAPTRRRMRWAPRRGARRGPRRRAPREADAARSGTSPTATRRRRRIPSLPRSVSSGSPRRMFLPSFFPPPPPPVRFVFFSSSERLGIQRPSGGTAVVL
jgi:hypothetical protein